MSGQGKDAKETIGFIGMGRMGSRMAARLLDAGYPLVVYNRSKERTQPLAQRGARVAATPRELAGDSEVVISSLADDAALDAVMFGPEGALAGMRQGSALIEMSTVHPSTSRHLAEAAQSRGASTIDAPVVGSTPQAEKGALVIFVGGAQETLDRYKPMLDVLGSQIFHIGANGMGVTMKLVVNALLGLSMEALGEALALGEKSGIEKSQLVDVLGQLGVLSHSQKAKLENARQDQYPATFPLRLMYKDFGLILRQAATLAVPMPATAVAQQMCAIEQAKHIEEDFSAVIRTLETLAGTEGKG